MATPNLVGITNVTPKVLSSAQLAVNDTAIYTVGANKAAKLATLTLCNVSGATVTVSVSIIPSGGTADGTHKIVHSYALNSADTLTVDEIKGAWLGDGDKVNVHCSVATAIDAVLTGLEFS